MTGPYLDPEPIVDDEASTHLFPEDTGGLTLGARKALVMLLKRHHIWSGRNPREWVTILDHRDGINSRLNDLFLELVVDEQREIAYKRQAGRDLGRVFTTLLQDTAYGREEAGILLHIREVYLRELRAGNESAYVDRAGLADEIDYVRPPGTKDYKRADQYLDNAVTRLVKDGFLVADRTDGGPGGDRDRLRISPVIEVLLTVERIAAFREALYVPDEEEEDDDAAG